MKAYFKTDFLPKSIDRAAGLAVLYYVLAVAVALCLTWIALSSLAARYTVYSDLSDRLAKLEDKARDGGQADASTGGGIKGSPFLEGDSLTIAGAALQKRVTGAVEEAGGTVLSSQTDLQPNQSEGDRIALTINFEVEQADLQKILYDIEAGMPFLFIDRLTVQMPEGAPGETPRLKVTMNVAGQWHTK